MISKFKTFIRDMRVEYVEFLLSTTSIIMGFWILMFVDFTPTLARILSIAPREFYGVNENIWAFLFIIRGILGVAGCLRYLDSKITLIRFTSFLGLALNLCILLSLLSANYQLLSGSAWVAIVVTQLISYIKLILPKKYQGNVFS